MAPGEVVIPNKSGVVIEDDMQHNNWDDCVEGDDTIDMPIEEIILIDD